jgi:thymidylate synthase (FAD)
MRNLLLNTSLKTHSIINTSLLKNTVLKNGFVKLIDCMPSVIPNEADKLKCDYAVVQAARVSYAQGLKDFETDSKLINYLFKHKHTSPFEMVKFKFHIKAPIFIARQWFRHRMGNYNEISARYSPLKDELYIPEKVSSQSKINKQLSANDNLLENERVNNLFNNYMSDSIQQFKNYNDLIDVGVSREIARIGLPLNTFTEFYFCIDLHNLLNFIKLRNSENAQYEIKEYASAIQDIVTELCPITMKAFNEHKTITLSDKQIKALEIFEFQYSKLSKREQNELANLLKNNV